MNFGGYALIDLRGPLSFQPEVLFAAKGHRIRDKDAQPITTSTGELKLPAADRVVLVRYLEFPLLLRHVEAHARNTSLYDRRPVIRLAPERRDTRGRRRRQARGHRRLGERQQPVVHRRRGRAIQALAGRCALHARDAKHRVRSRDPVAVKTGAFSVLMGARF